MIGLGPERRLLQIAQDVVHAFGHSGELHRDAADIEPAFALLQARQGVGELLGHQDARAAELADRRQRHLAAAARRHLGSAAGSRTRAWTEPRKPEPSAGEALEHSHHVDLTARPSGRLGRLHIRSMRALGSSGCGAVPVPGARLGHDVKVLQVAVEICVDGVDVAERALIKLLQDRVLDPLVALDRAQRFGECFDNRRRRQWVGGHFHPGTTEQIADGAVEFDELVVAQVLDHPHDISQDDRLVHRQRIDQRELARVDRGEVRLLDRVAPHAGLDMRAQLLLELGHQVGALGPEHFARVEEKQLIVADVGVARPRHQVVADVIEHRRKGQQQAMDREIPTIVENLRHLPWHHATGRRFAGGDHVHLIRIPECPAMPAACHRRRSVRRDLGGLRPAAHVCQSLASQESVFCVLNTVLTSCPQVTVSRVLSGRQFKKRRT